MKNQLVRQKLPEEIELDKKREELAILEDQLADTELEYSTLQAELQAFHIRYMKIVGVKLARLDEINAKIAEKLISLHPEDEQVLESFHQAKRQAEESAREVGDAEKEPEHKVKFSPTEDIKSLYREVAKKLHPDLASDEEERARRTNLMAEANAAYQAGDENRLKAILDEWIASPESVKGDDLGADLVRLVRKLSRAQRRIATVKLQIEKLKSSELSLLMEEVRKAKNRGRDLLSEMASELDRRIENQLAQLQDLEEKISKPII